MLNLNFIFPTPGYCSIVTVKSLCSKILSTTKQYKSLALEISKFLAGLAVIFVATTMCSFDECHIRLPDQVSFIVHAATGRGSGSYISLGYYKISPYNYDLYNLEYSYTRDCEYCSPPDHEK